ncbi:MAG: serine/threonine protein kinase, partial [Cellvibrionaceae bacterium]|nr:serine/threonine protein kinase [Cellvibrionaceae bacterium]
MQIPGYQIIRKISQGGMSSVYLAIQQSIGREVALKVISPALAQDQVFNERFNREANIIGQLSHPNIVAVYDIGSYRQLAYIAMDYLPGGSLSQRLCKGISSLEALRILKQLAAALAHAHSRGYIHRDIKPENILFRSDDTAVLTDFGVAKAVNHNLGMTNAGTVLGTPYYMSPEQAKGQPCDGRSDLYSLGVVFYEMLTAQLPYHAEEAVAIAIKHLTAPIPQLPAQYKLYQDLLERLLAKSPQDRVQSGAELVALIEQIETNMGIISPRAQLRTDPGSAELGVSQLSQTLVAMLWQQFIGLFKRHRRRTKINTLGNDKATAISQANSFTEPKQAASASAPFAGHRLIAIATLTLPLALVAGAVWQYSIKASSTGTNSAVVKPAAPNSKTQSFAQAPFTLKAQLAASRVNTMASPARVEMGAAQPPIRLVQAQTVTEPTAETNEEAEINTQTEELIEPASYTLRV